MSELVPLTLSDRESDPVTLTITATDQTPAHDVVAHPGEPVEVPRVVAEHFVHGEPERWSSPVADDLPGPYAGKTRGELEELIAGRDDVELPAEGTGTDGRVVKDDLVAALEAADRAAAEAATSTGDAEATPDPDETPAA